MAGRTRREESVMVKSFTDRIRLEREVAVLRFLGLTDFGRLIPKVLEVDAGSPTFRMIVIDGEEMTKGNADHKIVRQLGEIFAAIHGVRMFNTYGTFSVSLGVDEGSRSFSDFLSAQLDRWYIRVMEFSSDYEDQIRTVRRMIADRESQFNSLGSPRFCHNDFDLKNVLVRDGNVAGIIDWEFAGSYPLAWELRKMTASLFWEYPELWIAFVEGYSARDPLTVIPESEDLAILTAIDCIGALSWAYQESNTLKITALQSVLNQSLQKLP